MDQGRIAREALRRRHILERIARPEPVGVAKGAQTAFGRQAGAGQGDDTAPAHELSERGDVRLGEGPALGGVERGPLRIERRRAHRLTRPRHG